MKKVSVNKEMADKHYSMIQQNGMTEYGKELSILIFAFAELDMKLTPKQIMFALKSYQSDRITIHDLGNEYQVEIPVNVINLMDLSHLQ